MPWVEESFKLYIDAPLEEAFASLQRDVIGESSSDNETPKTMNEHDFAFESEDEYRITIDGSLYAAPPGTMYEGTFKFYNAKLFSHYAWYGLAIICSLISAGFVVINRRITIGSLITSGLAVILWLADRTVVKDTIETVRNNFEQAVGERLKHSVKMLPHDES